MTEIQPLDPTTFAASLDALAGVLHACVADGAHVNFVQPFTIGDARAFWVNKVAPGVSSGKRIVLAATLDAAIVGTVQLDLDTPPNQRHRAEIAKLLVLPDCRRGGVARALMAAIEGHAVAAGRWLLTLDTASAGAERLYASLGFERAGAIPAYSRDPVADRFDPAVIMFKILTDGRQRAVGQARR
jgi:ribosomal protein S18 acetylase RimI-like enzyme